MAPKALVASREGAVAAGFEAVVSALGYEVTDVLTTDQAENNQYHLPPGLVERLRDRIAETEAEYIALDGIAHAGQMVDLGTALQAVTIRDRRGVTWERLAEGENPAAAARLALRERRIERRRAQRDQRAESTTGPSGTSGVVSELDQACERHAEMLNEQQAAQRRRATESYEGVDAHVTVVGPVSAPTTECWEAITGQVGETGPLRPATPTTALAEIGPHTVAVTDTPGLVAGENDWFADAVPGTVAAIERANVLLVVGGSAEFDGVVVQCSELEEASGSEPDRLDDWREQVIAEIQAQLPTARLAVALPYTDEGHALVSTLHEEATVESVRYDEEIRLMIEIPESTIKRFGRQIERADGEWLEE